jgi:COMPASS component SWD2
MDSFVSASAEDGSVRIWDLNSPHASGRLNFVSPNLVAFDPSANVLAVSSGAAQSILLYDFRMYDKEPFATFDMLSDDKLVAPGLGLNTPDWTKLEFSNDGKSLLVGTNGRGHFLLDAFDGSLKHLLVRSAGGPHRLAAGETPTPPSDGAPSTSADTPLSSGDVTFTPDGRYVLSGQAGKPDVLVYDAHKPPQRANGTGDAPSVALMPEFELEASGTNGVVETGVLAFNPRFNMFASADKEVVFWVPDRDV